MRLIVADPLRTPAAREADLWLPVLPGEDWALIMAVLRRLLETGAGMDRDFMEKHTKRLAELRQLVVTDRRDPETGLSCTVCPGLRRVPGFRKSLWRSLFMP